MVHEPPDQQMALPVFREGDEPRPWWVVRCFDAWARVYWETRAPVPAKRRS